MEEKDPMMEIVSKVMIAFVGIMFLLPYVQQMLSGTSASRALQAQAFQGQEDPRDVHATNILSWLNLIYDYPYRPWVSAYFINDGPSAVEIGINYPDDRFTMNPGETITITRTGAEERISIIFFVCRPGLEAQIRVTGEY